MTEQENKLHYAFHSYCLKPNIRFEGQQEDEKVLLVLRPHPISQLSWLVNGLILLILLLLVDIVFYNALTFQQFLVVNLLSLAFIAAFFWFNFLGYFFNVGIITDKRLIDVDYHTVFYKDVSEAIYAKIEDVSAKSPGIFASFFDYGHVAIQTAGSNNNVQFESVPKPAQVASTISNLTE
ncbi:MAG: hypothetical protein WEC80_01615 [Patescibacteria group bacterium]